LRCPPRLQGTVDLCSHAGRFCQASLVERGRRAGDTRPRANKMSKKMLASSKKVLTSNFYN
jgi:hypothetical protein